MNKILGIVIGFVIVLLVVVSYSLSQDSVQNESLSDELNSSEPKPTGKDIQEESGTSGRELSVKFEENIGLSTP
ncbi:MAG: hypothetical protein K5790_08195 [Nitrosopumilus sp.]|uniref:hypothetical protein n=1 Tax=Nitrosopumilus sp. TaxID=2024843 RepID=UPI00247B4ABE|nr:hypothetical protein [Nitrosopumilus sp.]MCV0393248.1 hypothetical protein [Nitrosopumilus sp.]